MERDIEQELVAWKDEEGRLLLLVRGARQVGKSYTIEKFGRAHFSRVAVINFEYQPEAIEAFDSLNPEQIAARLEVYAKERIIPGDTLLFLDEIQACPRAILAMRYFKEKMPDLHVIGASSLLEFVLHEENFSFPVGRVQFLYLRPLSFREFLLAMGEERLVHLLDTLSLGEPLGAGLHQHALKLVRQYLLIGGMPAVVDKYRKAHAFEACTKLQGVLLDTYRNDFGKYARQAQHKYLSVLFEKGPALIGSHFRYSKIDPDIRSRELKVALEQLCHAGLLHRIHATAAAGLPLHAQKREKKFKILMLDVGLLQRANRVEAEAFFQQEILQVDLGRIAEQLVGQELLAYSGFYEDRNLYFWEREKRSSSAEVDYVLQIDAKIVPVEVKAGSIGRLQSLRQFMGEKDSPIGVRISQAPLSFEKKILSLPFYWIGQLPRLIGEAIG